MYAKEFENRIRNLGNLYLRFAYNLTLSRNKILFSF